MTFEDQKMDMLQAALRTEYARRSEVIRAIQGSIPAEHVRETIRRNETAMELIREIGRDWARCEAEEEFWKQGE